MPAQGLERDEVFTLGNRQEQRVDRRARREQRRAQRSRLLAIQEDTARSLSPGPSVTASASRHLVSRDLVAGDPAGQNGRIGYIDPMVALWF